VLDHILKFVALETVVVAISDSCGSGAGDLSGRVFVCWRAVRTDAEVAFRPWRPGATNSAQERRHLAQFIKTPSGEYSRGAVVEWLQQSSTGCSGPRYQSADFLPKATIFVTSCTRWSIDFMTSPHRRSCLR
jgi:hypothetical protein